MATFTNFESLTLLPENKKDILLKACMFHMSKDPKRETTQAFKDTFTSAMIIAVEKVDFEKLLTCIYNAKTNSQDIYDMAFRLFDRSCE